MSAAAMAVEYAELIDDGALLSDAEFDLPEIWGPNPSEEDAMLARKSNLHEAYEARKLVLENSLSRNKVAGLLQITEQAVTKQLERGSLHGLKERGRWAIPLWQLDPDTDTGVLPGIDRLSSIFPGGPVALAAWVVRPSAALDGRSPREFLIRNKVDEVIQLASSLGSAGW